MHTIIDGMDREAVRILNREIVTCTRCRLAQTRNNAVPGEGPADPRLLFIGEAPGKNEDLTGRPFVGRAGAVLEDLLASIGLERSGVFITSIIKCRPPENRIPRKDEIYACAEYLDRQIGILLPEIIIPMGRLASEQVFSRFRIPHGPISSIHGKIFFTGTSGDQPLVIIPVYHPAAVTHNPLLKDVIFDDFRVIGTLIRKSDRSGSKKSGTG
jgi:DNA polymerase